MSSRALTSPFLVLPALVLAFYCWTATGAEKMRLRVRQTDYFNSLAHGFLKGHLYLDAEVPRGLIQAEDPYDPAKRPDRYLPHDASYYNGHYYIYFGPAPVITLLVPFTVLTHLDLPAPAAVLIFGCGGYIILLLTFSSIARGYYPSATKLNIWSSVLVLSTATMIIGLLRRPAGWELPIACGFFYLSFSLFTLVLSLESTRHLIWLRVASLALGMSIASRPTYIFAAAIFLLVPIFRSSFAALTPTSRWRLAIASLGPVAVIVAFLLLYNYLRFGKFLEFGETYQLNSILDRQAKHFSAGYIPFNSIVYFVAPLHLQHWFPFVRGISYPPVPAGYYGCEYCFGVLTNLPVTLFAIAGASLFISTCSAGQLEVRRRKWIFSIFAITCFANLTPLLVWFSSCVRYMADFMPYLAFCACLGLLEIERRLRSKSARVLLSIVGLVAAVVTALAASLAVVENYEADPRILPARYFPIARIMNYPVTVIDRTVGRH